MATGSRASTVIFYRSQLNRELFAIRPAFCFLIIAAYRKNPFSMGERSSTLFKNQWRELLIVEPLLNLNTNSQCTFIYKKLEIFSLPFNFQNKDHYLSEGSMVKSCIILDGSTPLPVFDKVCMTGVSCRNDVIYSILASLEMQLV